MKTERHAVLTSLCKLKVTDSTRHKTGRSSQPIIRRGTEETRANATKSNIKPNLNVSLDNSLQ